MSLAEQLTALNDPFFTIILSSLLPTPSPKYQAKLKITTKLTTFTP
jgi:hypothetical protein